MGKKIAVDTSSIDGDLVAEIKAHQKRGLVQTEGEQKAFLKTLESKGCTHGLHMWAALFGTLEMKKTVAQNPSSSITALQVLMLDSESAPEYVLDILNRRKIFKLFIVDLYGSNAPPLEEESIEDLIQCCSSFPSEESWMKQLKEGGSSDILQIELIRIISRFIRTWNNMVAYQLSYDDEMFLTLELAIDSFDSISIFTKNILRAFLRLSQIQQRGSIMNFPPKKLERYESVLPVVDAFLRSFKSPIPFVATY